MPLYKFSCPGCGHKFGKVFPSPPPTALCPKCPASAERLLSSPRLQVASQAQVLPTAVATGVASVDYDLDRAVGRSSKEGWKLIETRQDRKRELLAEAPEGTTGKNLVRTPENDYVVASSDRVAVVASAQEKIRPLVNQVVEKARRDHGTEEKESPREWDIRGR